MFVLLHQTNTRTMTTFKSNSEAVRKAEAITNCKSIFYTNEGFEISFTSENSKEEVKEIAEKLKAVFSNVVIKGRKVQSILVNKISQNVQQLRITEVTY